MRSNRFEVEDFAKQMPAFDGKMSTDSLCSVALKIENDDEDWVDPPEVWT